MGGCVVAAHGVAPGSEIFASFDGSTCRIASNDAGFYAVCLALPTVLTWGGNAVAFLFAEPCPFDEIAGPSGGRNEPQVG